MACEYDDKLFTHLHKSPFFCIVHSLTAGCESYGSCEVSWGALGRNSSSRYHLKRQMRNIAIPDSRLCGRPVGIANCLRIPSNKDHKPNQTSIIFKTWTCALDASYIRSQSYPSVLLGLGGNDDQLQTTFERENITRDNDCRLISDLKGNLKIFISKLEGLCCVYV